MNALDFLVEFVHLEGTSDHLLPQHSPNTNIYKHPICNTEAEVLTSAYFRAYGQHHSVQEAPEQEATCNFPTIPLSTQHVFSVSASHLPDLSVTNFEHHDIPHPSIERNDHTSQTFTGYLEKQQRNEYSHEMICVIPQAYYQHSNGHAPWTMGYEASSTQAPVLNTWYDPQTPYIFQPTRQQEIHYVPFSEESLPVLIYCNNSICGCWAQKPQGCHPIENTWPPWNTTQAPYGPEVLLIYNNCTLEPTKRANFSTV